MENGKMTRPTVLVNTVIKRDHVTKVIGSRTNNMDKAKRLGQTTHAMKVNTKMVKSTVKVSSFGPIIAPTQENFSIMISMESVSTTGLMAANTMVNLRTANNTVKVYSRSKMAADTKASITMTRKKVEVYLCGLMEDHTMVNGRTANNKVLVSLHPQVVM